MDNNLGDFIDGLLFDFQKEQFREPSKIKLGIMQKMRLQYEADQRCGGSIDGKLIKYQGYPIEYTKDICLIAIE